MQQLMTRTTTATRYLGAFAAGALATFSFAPFNIAALAIISSGIFYYLVLTSTTKHAFGYGMIFASGLFLVATSWVYIAIHHFGHTNGLLAVFFVILFAVIMACYYGIHAWLFCFINKRQRNDLSDLLFTSLWVLSEYTRSYLFGGFPWLLWGYSQLTSPLKQFAPIVGVYGVSFISIWVSCLCARLCYRKQRRSIVLRLSLISLACLALYQVKWIQPSKQTLTVRLIQANINQDQKQTPEDIERLLQTYLDMTKQDFAADLIVWPESAIPLPDSYVENYLDGIDQLAKQHQTNIALSLPLVTTIPDHYYNGLLVLGQTHAQYHKRNLVIFGEYLPLERYLRGLIDLFNIPFSSFIAEQQPPQLIKLAGVKLASYICYDIVFANYVKQTSHGADILLTVSDNSWFGPDIMPAQFLQMAQMRSLELGRAQIAVTNTGISAAIKADGQLQYQLPASKRSSGKVKLEATYGQTPFSILPNSTLPLLLLIIVTVVSRKLLTKPAHG